MNRRRVRVKAIERPGPDGSLLMSLVIAALILLHMIFG
jgi:hypothetical protein